MKYLPLLLLFFACKTTPPQVTSNTMDSTMVEVRKRVDTVYLAGEVVELPPIVIECDSATNKPKPLKQKKVGKNVSASANLKNGVLTVRCKEDSLMVITKRLDSIVFRLRHEDITITPPPVVTHEPWWFDVLFRWWALITALALAWRYRKGAIGLLGKLIR